MTGRKKRHVARSVEDKAKKRDLILDAAMRLLSGRGYTKTTMSDVAAEAAVGRGTIYWHFSSKDDLFYCLLEREVGKFDVGFASVMDVEAPAQVEGKLKRILIERQGAPVSTDQQPLLGKGIQVGPNRSVRDAKLLGEIGDGHTPHPCQHFQDLIATLLKKQIARHGPPCEGIRAGRQAPLIDTRIIPQSPA